MPLLFAAPWVCLLLFLILVKQTPSELPRAAAKPPRETALVSVIVPARDEAPNIQTCVSSLVRSSYSAFEIIVVDDQSTDGTGSLVRGMEQGNARSLRVIDGEQLPTEWLGKPWACCQGAAVAEGDLLLFTDADTVHGPELLGRAVAGLCDERADLLTVMGRQLMKTFWERLVQPQIFLPMFIRFPNLERTAKSDHWRGAVANGQFMLFRREIYNAIGGHEAVKDEVVEDLALAQLVKRQGFCLRIRAAETDLFTRMYRSLAHLVEGWSKNITTGGMQSLPPWTRSFVAPVALAIGIALWIVPPVVLLVAILGVFGDGLLLWSASVCALSAILWVFFTSQMGAPGLYGLLYPVGALVGAYIFLRSSLRGSQVEWKGRRYKLPPLSDRP